TREAAKLANIECTEILQEPIAASLHYAWRLAAHGNPERHVKETILVFDLGGGTFDLTLFELQVSPERFVFEVLATGGDDRLGGMDFDERLVELLLRKSGLSLEGLSPIEKRLARQKILGAAIEAKESLSD